MHTIRDGFLLMFAVVFGGKVAHSSLSHIYRDLRCEHHFVQIDHDNKPSVPALTPAGFARWMECSILAHPDLEYKRLAYAVLHMPINTPTTGQNAFPKNCPELYYQSKKIGQFIWILKMLY